MTVWIAESPYERKGFLDEAKAKTQCLAWFAEDAEDIAKSYHYDDFDLQEGLADLAKGRSYIFCDYEADDMEFAWYQLEIEE